MNLFHFRLSQDEETLRKWIRSALEQCAKWNPLPGSPNQILHFFYPGSIRGVVFACTDENEYSMAIGPFSSDDDIAKVATVLELALSLGVRLEVRESVAEMADSEQSHSLLSLLFPFQNTDFEEGEFHDLPAIDGNFAQVMKKSAWHNHQETDGEDTIGIEIVDYTFSINLDKSSLTLPQPELEAWLVDRVRGVMNSPVRVMINEYSQIWRPNLGMITVSDYKGESCYISTDCSHVALYELDPRFSGRLILLQDLYALTKEEARLLGRSIFIPSLMERDKEDWFAKLDEHALALPPLV